MLVDRVLGVRVAVALAREAVREGLAARLQTEGALHVADPRDAPTDVAKGNAIQVGVDLRELRDVVRHVTVVVSVRCVVQGLEGGQRRCGGHGGRGCHVVLVVRGHWAVERRAVEG